MTSEKFESTMLFAGQPFRAIPPGMAESRERGSGVAELAPEWQRAVAFVEERVGGRVVRAERQARWRPAFFFDVETEDGLVPIYFRGARGEAGLGVYTLEHEGAVLEVLGAHGVPVPGVRGVCADPPGLVLDCLPGRENLATATSEEERRTVLAEYMEWLARMHEIDPGEFEARGLVRPVDEDALALGDLASWEKAYRKNKVRPEPMIEFVLAWLKRNRPAARPEVTFLSGDAGQFLFDDGHLTGVLDLELAYLGDPAADLGALFGRTLSEPLGDIEAGIRVYEKARGIEVDRRVVQFNAARFGICTPLAVAHLCAAPPKGLVYAQYLGWFLVYGRAALEWIAGLAGIELVPPEAPQAIESPYAPAFASLRAALAPKQGEDEFAAFEKESIDRTAIYLERAARFGASVAEADEAEARALLGTESGCAGDAELEAFVRTEDPQHDAEILRLLHRRLLRQEFLLAPAMKEIENTIVPRLV